VLAKSLGLSFNTNHGCVTLQHSRPVRVYAGCIASTRAFQIPPKQTRGWRFVVCTFKATEKTTTAASSLGTRFDESLGVYTIVSTFHSMLWNAPKSL
jgi:hypothetical protein